MGGWVRKIPTPRSTGGVKQPVAAVPCVFGLRDLDPPDPPAGVFPASLGPDLGATSWDPEGPAGSFLASVGPSRGSRHRYLRKLRTQGSLEFLRTLESLMGRRHEPSGFEIYRGGTQDDDFNK